MFLTTRDTQVYLRNNSFRVHILWNLYFYHVLAFTLDSFYLSQNIMKYLLQVLVSFLKDEATWDMDDWNELQGHSL